MSLGRIPAWSVCVALCLALLATVLPAAAVAAPEERAREYIVTLSVTDSERSLLPSSRGAKQRIRQRARRASETTARLVRAADVRAAHRFGYAFTGFSASMTPAQAAVLAADPKVARVREARIFRISSQDVPPGVRRVKAWTSGGPPVADVDAHVAVIDTGVGPADRNGVPTPMTTYGSPPKAELDLRGGVNCYDDPRTPLDEAWEHGRSKETDGWWGDTQGHGTHVAGIIGARDNGVGVVGVAPGVRLWSVRVFKGTSGTEASVACGIEWAIATHLDPDIPDIDVINLSIEGSRIDQQEDCATIQADPRADVMQKAICTATDMGIVVVASAGNSSIDANRSAPGGFDRVISVAAMTDTDGSGWGAGRSASCRGGRGERDDTFAGYSNHGREVDIVAPGTCVASTSHTDPDGDAVVIKTGTSMAAPHVSGAVARYIARHGAPSTVAQMRDLVRAAGRLDWDARSDPGWYGVNDSDPPNRVLDVKALTGGPLVRAWTSHSTFRVGGSERRRRARIDIQRGGYAGAVSLSLAGLPPAAGSGTFGQASLAGLGRAKLGTNLDLHLRTSTAAEGEHDLDVVASGAGVVPHQRRISLLVDRTGPTVSQPSLRLRGGQVSLLASGAARAILRWQVDDSLSGVRTATLQRKVGGSAWRKAGEGGLSSARVTLKPGQADRFRVKATDKLGNAARSPTIDARLSVRDSTSGTWQRPAGQWQTKRVKKAFGGSILLAHGVTDSLATAFRGKAVAVVGSVGPGRGTFRVRVDGGAWSEVSLRTRKPGHRKVVWSRTLASGSHVLEMQGLDGQTALDALLIVR